MLLEEALPEDVFSVYWRVTMPALMRCFISFLYIAGTKISNSWYRIAGTKISNRRKYGDWALAPTESTRAWSVIEHIDLPAVVRRLEELTGEKLLIP